MLALSSDCRIYIASKPVDMRRSHDGLAATVKEFLGKEPSSGNIFVFFNKGSNRVKIFYWDRNGYCLWYKRLESGRFSPPKVARKSFKVNSGELALLLEGIDLTQSRLRRLK